MTIQAKVDRKVGQQFHPGDWAILAGLCLMFAPTFQKLMKYGWKNADYTHAVFILPAALWLIWRKREGLRKGLSASGTSYVLFGMGIIMYLFAALNNFMYLEALSFVLVVWALFMAKLDKPSIKSLIFPLAYLLFLVPPPGLIIDSITYPLKEIATFGSYNLLKLAHLPVRVSGAILRVGDYDFFVSDACSGFRSMITLLALGSAYAHLQNTSTIKKWVIFVSVIPLGIAGNTLRIFLTGCIGHYIGIKYAEGFFHEMSGGIVFIFTILGLILITKRISGQPNAVK